METAAFLVAAYGAVLSTILALRAWRRDRRTVRVMSTTLISVGSGGSTEYLLEVRALNERHRPVHVRQGAVILQDGTVFHPRYVDLKFDRPTPPALLEDGQHVSCYFDARSFDDERYVPHAVFVEDFADRPYVKKLSDDERAQLRSLAQEAIDRKGVLD